MIHNITPCLNFVRFISIFIISHFISKGGVLIATNYRILTTGSHGNAVLIGDILIDLGLTKKKLKSLIELDQIQYVFVTHRHADHLNLPLARHFIAEGVQCFFPQGVADKLMNEGKINPYEHQNVTVFEPAEDVSFICGDIVVTAVPQKHWDIVNVAYVVETESERILYATDLDTLSPSSLGVGLHHLAPFDIIFLEGNYDEEWLREYIVTSISILDPHYDFETLNSDELNTWVRNNYRQLPRDMSADLFRAVQNMRHLSKQQARSYVKDHLKPNGKYYEIHRSSLFYERPNDWDENATILDGNW